MTFYETIKYCTCDWIAHGDLHPIIEKMMFLKEKKSALYDTVMGGADKSGRAYAISKSDFDFLLN